MCVCVCASIIDCAIVVHFVNTPKSGAIVSRQACCFRQHLTEACSFGPLNK